MGAKTSDRTTIGFGDQTISNVTPLHIALHNQTPEIVARILKAKDISTTMDMRCRDSKGKIWTSLELAVKIVEDLVAENQDSNNAKMVGNFY